MIDHAVMNAFFRELEKIAAPPLRGKALAAHLTEGLSSARNAVESTHEAFRAHLHSVNPKFKVQHGMSEAARAQKPHLDLRKTNPELYAHDTYKAHENAVGHLKGLEEEAKKHEKLFNKVDKKAKTPDVQKAPEAPHPVSDAPTGGAPEPKGRGTKAPAAPGEGAVEAAEAAPEAASTASATTAKPGFFQRNAGTLAAGGGIAALGGAGYAGSRMINRPQQ